MSHQHLSALHLRRSTLALGLLLSAACSPESAAVQSVQPAASAVDLPVPKADATADLAAPPAGSARENSEGQSIPSPELDPERPLPSKSVVTRVRELRASIRVYRELPLEGRLEHLRRVYEHELLELGQTLASMRRDDGTLEPYFASQAVTTFEELAFESGEDSDLGLRAYQCLADLKREAGLLDEAEDYEEALQRLLDERDD